MLPHNSALISCVLRKAWLPAWLKGLMTIAWWFLCDSAICLLVAGVDTLGGREGETLGGPCAAPRGARGARVRTASRNYRTNLAIQVTRCGGQAGRASIAGACSFERPTTTPAPPCIVSECRGAPTCGAVCHIYLPFPTTTRTREGERHLGRLKGTL